MYRIRRLPGDSLYLSIRYKYVECYLRLREDSFFRIALFCCYICVRIYWWFLSCFSLLSLGYRKEGTEQSPLFKSASMVCYTSDLPLRCPTSHLYQSDRRCLCSCQARQRRQSLLR